MKNKAYLLNILAILIVSLPGATYAASPYIGEQKTIKAAEDDTFVYLARDYNLGYLDLVIANPDIDPWIPGAGTEIILPTRHILPDAKPEGLLINLAEMRLYYFAKKGEPPLSFPLGVGREGLETPTGTTTIVNKVKGPTWRPTDRMREEKPELPAVVGPGMDNPLGTHALYLGWSQYLIHGTNRPFGVGRRSSSGCMRMYPENIVKIFNMVPVGTKVTVIEQPVKGAWIDDTLYLEIHPTMAQSTIIEDKGFTESFTMTGDTKEWITNIAGTHADKLDWDQITAMVAKPSGVPTAVISLKDANMKKPKVEKPEEPASDNKQAEKPAPEKVETPKENIPKEASKPLPETEEKQETSVEKDATKETKNNIETTSETNVSESNAKTETKPTFELN
jgi:L,D-transpeptidase ErfK/SrfK